MGTGYEGRLDPLDPAMAAKAAADGLQLYATVLEPGQTILAPNGWWHYAVSLSPTITLMNNFWDRANISGFEELFLTQIARSIDGTSEASARARRGMPERELRPPMAYRVLHKPFVYVRAAPSTRAAMLGILRPGDEVLAGCEHDGWLRTAMPFDKGRHGWLLLDGAPLGMGQLLARADAIPVI